MSEFLFHIWEYVYVSNSIFLSLCVWDLDFCELFSYSSYLHIQYIWSSEYAACDLALAWNERRMSIFEYVGLKIV